MRAKLTEGASARAIKVFGQNLYHLLMQAPLKGRVVLGFDPAYRTGCKLAVLDPHGKVEQIAVIYPTNPPRKLSGPRPKRSFGPGGTLPGFDGRNRERDGQP